MARLGDRLRRAFRKLWPRALPPLDADLVGRERLFRAPPFTPELVAAIRLISPQYALRATEASRVYWEAEQNGACWGEYEALGPLLEKLGTPQKVLEIGPGMGRSVVFLRSKLRWEHVHWELYESDGSRTRYTTLGPRFDDSFCGSVDLLRGVLEHNGVENARIIDARDVDCRLSGLEGPYDLIYGFYSIGFHWSLEHYLDEVLGLMHPGSIACFTVPPTFEEFPGLAEVPHRLLRAKAVWPVGTELRLLVLGERAVP